MINNEMKKYTNPLGWLMNASNSLMLQVQIKKKKNILHISLNTAIIDTLPQKNGMKYLIKPRHKSFIGVLNAEWCFSTYAFLKYHNRENKSIWYNIEIDVKAIKIDITDNTFSI